MVTLATHNLITTIKPQHVILIAAENSYCFTDSEIYLSGKSRINQLVLPVVVKMATVVSRNDLVRKIKEANIEPTPIRTRTFTYNFLYYFSCCCLKKRHPIGIDSLDDDEHGDDNLQNMSYHPDNKEVNDNFFGPSVIPVIPTYRGLSSRSSELVTDLDLRHISKIT